MRRRMMWPLLAHLTLVVAAVPAEAQSSIFGIRGPGFPGRPLSTRAIGAGGGLGLFDAESQLNPASLTATPNAFGAFTVLGDFRGVTTPAGSATSHPNGRRATTCRSPSLPDRLDRARRRNADVP